MVRIALFAAAIGALLAGGLLWGHLRWAAATRAWLGKLEAARTAPVPRHPDERERHGLPPPVQRYFRTALRPGAPIIEAVSIRHEGTFNVSESGEQWKPFQSTQRVVTKRPGFVWDGRVAMAPGLAVFVHDAYVAGEGVLHPAVAGVFSLMEMQGGGEVARGELMRFLAEAAWYPTALLPSQGVRWEAVDERSARATLTDGPISVSLTFVFGPDGLIDAVRADARGRTAGGSVVQTPWEGRWSRYEERHGMRVPMEGEVAWLAAEGRLPYWRGRVVSVSYEPSPMPVP